jgi:hypothetical protein
MGQRTINGRGARCDEALPEDEMATRSLYSSTGGGATWDWLSAYTAHDIWGKIKIRK